MSADRFDAEAYWSQRLEQSWDLTGVGHRDYPPSYNAWLYRRKRAVLRRGLRGHQVGRALDIGSGIGWVVRQLLDAGATDVTGVELSGDAVDRLRSAVPAARFLRADITRHHLEVPDATVDTVTMLDVAYHVTADEGLITAMTEVERTLKPGGIVLVSDAWGDEPPLQPPATAHVRFRSRQDWEPVLSASGLTIRRVLPYFAALSRPRGDTWRHWWHPRVRGPVEWAMDTALASRPWLRLAILQSAASSDADRPTP